MNDKTPEQLTAEMLRKELWVVTTKPARGPGIRALLAEHLDYQVNLEREGILFGAGPIYAEDADTPEGGMIILRAAGLDEARAIADKDPLHANGLREYTVHKWLLNEGAMTMTVRYSDQSVSIE